MLAESSGERPRRHAMAFETRRDNLIMHCIQHFVHLLVQLAQALLDFELELVHLDRDLRRRHARVDRDRRDRDGVLRERRRRRLLGFSFLDDALRDERRDGLLDLVGPLHHLRIDRQPVAQSKDAQLLDDALVDATQLLDVALHGERALQPALLPEGAHGRVELLQ